MRTVEQNTSFFTFFLLCKYFFVPLPNGPFYSSRVYARDCECIALEWAGLISGNNMLKRSKYIILLLLLALLPAVAGAQNAGSGFFTLTNGNLWWFDGEESDADDATVGGVARRYPIAYDKSNSWAAVHPLGGHKVTHITEHGDYYFALDTTDAANPQVVARPFASGFTLLCAWYRTGYTGYYYQEWGGYRYYLVGSSSTGLSVVKVAVGSALSTTTYWYNWDFGAALQEDATVNGANVSSYYWLIYDTLDDATGKLAGTTGTTETPRWRLSGNTYYRPNDSYYLLYNAPDVYNNVTGELRGYNRNRRRYYDDVAPATAYDPDDTLHHAAGTSALYLPVDTTVHPTTIDNIVSGYGLTALAVTSSATGFTAAVGETPATLPFSSGAEVTLTSTIVTDDVVGDEGVPMDYTPGYIDYAEETYRRGINLNYRLRSADEFGSAGVPTVTHHYLYDGTLNNSAPTQVSSNIPVSKIEYSIDNRSKRYVELDTTSATATREATLTCVAPPLRHHTVQITVTVTYANGATQTLETELDITYEKPVVVPEAVKGPVVRGRVYGGGRMANVQGNTSVTIHNTDSIYALYGGNDIAGWVQGDDGATIQLGTLYTNADHPVHIGYVYGGGCGYYTYRGINMSPVYGFPYRNGTALQYGNYYFGHTNGATAVTDTNWVYNPGFLSQAASLGLTIQYKDHYNPITGVVASTPYFITTREDMCGKVYRWNTIPTVEPGYTSSYTAYDSTHLVWPEANLVPGTEDICFSYNPVYDTPENVDQAEDGNGGNGTVPYIKTAHITVGIPEGSRAFVREGGRAGTPSDSTHHYNDHIVIDSLFGGAENAFIGVTSNDANHPERGITVDVNGGTIYALFGGNNYGGSVAQTSTVYVDVHDTKLVHEADQPEDTYLTGYGRDFGIRYLFGGGNKVAGSDAHVTFYGGMVDTAYVGGNSASVTNPIGLVDCQPSATRNEYGHYGHYICTNPSYPKPNGIYEAEDAEHVFLNPEDFTTTVEGETVMKYGPDTWEGEVGQYNIRCLFAGNNSADMENLAVVQLHAGGVSSVYGGGNSGDMKNDVGVDSFSSSVYATILKKAFDLDPSTSTLASQTGGWVDLFGGSAFPTKISAIVSALHDSKITCDYVYGGARMGNIRNSCGVYAAGGVFGYVNGGNDISGDIGSETGGGSYVILDSNVLVVGDVAGGSDGFYHCNDGTGHYDETELFDSYSGENYDPYDEYVGLLMPTSNAANVYMRGGVVLGTVVTGGLHTDVGYAEGATPRILENGVERAMTPLEGDMHGKVRMLLSGGHVYGDVYGGGYQSNIYGLAYERVKGNVQIDGSLFAGNDVVGSIKSFGPYYSNIDYAGCTTAADSLKADTLAYAAFINSLGERLNRRESDGSYNAHYDAYLKIEGTPTIKRVYGSGNGAFNYDGDPDSPFEPVSVCLSNSETSRPLQTRVFIDINTSGGQIDTVFGGGNGVGVSERVTVLLNNTENNVHTVHTIFGGNNFAEMSIVPEVRLEKGQVNTVFGGSNDGNMTAGQTFTDICGNEVTGVSTHVVVNSEDVTVLDTLFGGCRRSDVNGMSFVEVRGTNAAGINYLFGGNDISGSIGGNTRVDICGGTVKHVYGGSNGRYDYVLVGDGQYNVYPFGSVASGDSAGHLITTAARPNVDSSSVNFYGGTVANDLYGGGSMADCRTTHVELNDQVGCDGTGNATLNGIVYGGGEGMWSDLNARDLDGTRYGTISEATHVDLRHITTLSNAVVYGGGKGGDAFDTYITLHDTWNQNLEALYGGCWGGNVMGTSHVTVSANASSLASDAYNVRSLYGGNDFTGNVYKTLLTVNSGKFNNIYGGSNGDYAASAYTSGAYASNHLRVPNSQYIEVTFNDGTVDSNLYGGGKLGTTFCFVKNSDGSDYVDPVTGHKTPDTTLTAATAHTDPLDYAYIITNVHSGTFGNIFGGARGSRSDTKAMVYGLKVVNMDGGYINESLYGGSQNVNDGYAAECKSSSTTTKRPSTIVNLAGGTVEGNLYGAGYLSYTHGSVYVNVGQDAIDSCVAYKQTYAGNDSAYWQFKPGEAGSLSPALGTGEVLLNHSIYAGANWGGGSGSADFTAQGFYGGESKVRVDGEGYNTANDELSSLPNMNIAKSIFCSGTSADAGDIRNSKNIDVWNYGSIVNCQPTRQLESVQRTDSLWFHNACVELTGATDATSAYFSNSYSLRNVINTAFRGYNVVQFDATIDNAPVFLFYEEPLLADGSLSFVPIQNLRQYSSTDACDADATMCDNLSVVDPDADGKQHTLLILNNGIEMDLKSVIHGIYARGMLSGFSYVCTPKGYYSTINAMATAWYNEGVPSSAIGYTDWDSGLGGFASPCETINKYTADRGIVSWTDYSGDEQRLESELPYTNFNSPGTYGDYRTWKIGDSLRMRETTILAHNDPTKLDQDVSIKLHGNSQMAIAEATLLLPATSTGHYYKINSSITLDGENSLVNLIDSAFVPAKNFTTLNTYYEGGGAVDDPTIYGELLGDNLDLAGLAQGMSEIVDHPTNTFGLAMVPGEFFEGYSEEYYKPSSASFVMPTATSAIAMSRSMFVVSGNSHVTSTADYCSPKVASGDNIQPTMKFYLTYNTEFPTTFLGTVDFTLMEYDENNVEVGPIEVKVNISTIIDEFKPVTTNVLAMYNAGRTNTFTRKVTLPATLDEDRKLYLKSAYWVPTDGNGDNQLASKKFFIVGDTAVITAADSGVNNLFALKVIPTDKVSSEVSTAIGWSHITEDTVNIYNLKPHTAATRYSDSTALTTPDSLRFYNRSTGDRGILIGTLDGRGPAGLDIELAFDGKRIYPSPGGKGYVGRVVLTMESFLGDESKGEFPVTVYVKTRKHGDTIYLASAESVTRGGQTVYPYDDNHSDYAAASAEDKPSILGKRPNAYVQTFQEALSASVYQEGDVIAIIDKVVMNDGLGVSIFGGDGPAIEVIRYDGHHHELYGENGVYRNAMISVSNNTEFSASNIAFHGGAGAVIKKTASSAQTPDTNRVYGPIIQVMNGGAVTLKNGTTVKHNWNNYGSVAAQLDANGLPADATLMGAINVTGGSSLTLLNDVTVEDNFSRTYDNDGTSYNLRPYNGAVYVDGGRVVLPEAGTLSSIDITKNYLLDTTVDGTKPWWTVNTLANETRWLIDESKVALWKKANVFLTRTEVASVPEGISGADAIQRYKDLHDVKSDVIVVSGRQNADTRIGVRKWFPGPTTRDTIAIATAYGSNLTVLSRAVSDGIFTSDDDNNIFYSAKVNNENAYFFRCATFRHQMEDVPLALENGGGSYSAGDVLSYDYLETATCPTGVDAVLYRLQGGFLPYTFTWDWNDTLGLADEEHTSTYSNNVVQNALKNGDTSYYMASVVDTLAMPPIAMGRSNGATKKLGLTVTAVDNTGVCSLTKNIALTLHLVNDLDGHSKWEPVTSPNNGWTDTASAVAGNRVTAAGDRYYQAIQITPKVWADRSEGTITAVVTGDNNDLVVYRDIEGESDNELSGVIFCEGDKIRLKTNPRTSPSTPQSGARFIMWDINPFYENPITYVVPPQSSTVIAYYGPNDYWHNHIKTAALGGAALASSTIYTSRPTVDSYTLPGGATSTEAAFVTTYNGDVHIYNENGLAWFISVVNGLNGQQVRPFRFNRVFVHRKDAANTPYDMKDYRWFPVGSSQYGFRGRLIGVSESVADTVRLTGDNRVAIKNIIIDEPDRPNVGFFGYLDTAKVSSIELKGVFVRGGQYVGALAGVSEYTRYDNVGVTTSDEGENTTSILSTRYASGGFVGKSDHDNITNSNSWAKYVGDAVYSGGITGDGTVDTVSNNVVRNDSRMSGVYVGGLVGKSTGEEVRPAGLFSLRRKSAGTPSRIMNNYVRMESSGNANRVGGLVGYADNTVIENNYVYGQVVGSAADGGVAADLDNNAEADKNYYANGGAKHAVGSTSGNATLTDVASFEGSGNHVLIDHNVYGINNLTRVLNKWVREQNAQGGRYNTWRSDLLATNHGYPIFGEPDIIPVQGTQTIHGCEEVVVNGVTYTHDSSFTVQFIDSVEMVDSTLTAFIVLHHGTLTEVSDSASMDEDYEGYGFAITAAEMHLLELSRDSAGYATLVLTDTLSTEYGCDSIVVLTLTLSSSGGIIEEGSPVKVYPNPTVNIIHVEAKEMSRVEIYDNEGRVLLSREEDNTDHTTLDLTYYAAGVYYIRVHTPNGITIQKVIKR